MSAPIELLLVEDSEDDAMLTLHALKRGGLALRHERVDRASALEAALARQTWDAVISDYNLPGFTGLDALRITRREAPGIPFILVSGVVGEEIAVDAMKSGASDYVTKKNLSRLAPALERELQEAANRVRITQMQHELAESEQRYRQVMQALPGAVYSCDTQGRIMMFNQAAALLWGREPRIGEDRWCGSWRIFTPDGTPVAPEECAMALAMRGQPAARDTEIVIERPDGSRRQVVPHPQLLFESAGVLTGAVNMLIDVTERNTQHAQIRLAAQVFAQGREGLLVVDAKRKVLMVNQAFTDITGYTPAEVLGQDPRVLAGGERGQDVYLEMWAVVQVKGLWQGEIWNRDKQGMEYLQRLSISSMHDAYGQVSNYICTFSDISAQKTAEAKVTWLSHFDPLTGLPNRTLLADRGSHDIGMAQRENKPLAVVVLGIDGFKTVNDSFGHTIGDELLQQFAQRLKTSLRERDTVARVDGDEFVLVLPATEPDGAGLLAVKLQRILSEPYLVGAFTINATACMGAAMYPLDGTEFEQLLKSAEIAMHLAKENGRGKFRFFDIQMLEATVARAALVNALRNAASNGELALHYQPFVDLQTGRVAGMEALLRWNHPQLGAVPPARFIPVAEQSELIVGIGAWVLRQACRDIRDWLDRGIQAPPVSVNISPVQFRDAGLLRQIEDTLREFAVEPRMLCIEVTEGALMEDVAHSVELLRSFKALGLALSLDDFGTGYSSLSYLKLFPFDKVKIDQSFVRGLSTNSHDAVIAKVVISMAHGLGLRVIAEGVETEAQCEFMRGNVCDEIQGYFFSRPIPREAMQDLLVADRRLPPHLVRVHTNERTLLLVDDEPNVVSSLKRLLRGDGYRILTANSGPEGLEMLDRHPVDIIVSDQRMPGMTGVEFLRRAKELHPETVRIVLSGYTELQSVTDAINEGAVYRFLTKPWDDAQLRGFIKEAFQHKELADENTQLNLKIRTVNQELATSNRRLEELLDRKKQKIKRQQQSLEMVREVLQCIPMPVIGLDDEGMIAFVNTPAQSLFTGAGGLLGREIATTLPDLDALLSTTPEGEHGHTDVDHLPYRVRWQYMGQHTRSSGRIVTLSPAQVNP